MYVSSTREINAIELQKQALVRINQLKLIDTKRYRILSSGIFEGVTLDEEEGPVDIFQVITCDMTTCDEQKHIFRLAKDLYLKSDQIFNYYLYRFPNNVDGRLGKAIRVVKEATDDDPGFAYNALLVNYNVRQMTFIMIPSRGPFHRILTARQAYHHNIKFHVYQEPDDTPDLDNIDNGCQCDMIR